MTNIIVRRRKTKIEISKENEVFTRRQKPHQLPMDDKKTGESSAKDAKGVGSGSGERKKLNEQQPSANLDSIFAQRSNLADKLFADAEKKLEGRVNLDAAPTDDIDPAALEALRSMPKKVSLRRASLALVLPTLQTESQEELNAQNQQQLPPNRAKPDKK